MLALEDNKEAEWSPERQGRSVPLLRLVQASIRLRSGKAIKPQAPPTNEWFWGVGWHFTNVGADIILMFT